MRSWSYASAVSSSGVVQGKASLTYCRNDRLSASMACCKVLQVSASIRCFPLALGLASSSAPRFSPATALAASALGTAHAAPLHLLHHFCSFRGHLLHHS